MFSLLTRGVVEIFRHDWTLAGEATAKALGYTPTLLQAGLRQTLDAPPFAPVSPKREHLGSREGGTGR